MVIPRSTTLSFLGTVKYRTRMQSYSACRQPTDLPQLVTMLAVLPKSARDEQVNVCVWPVLAVTGDAKGHA